MVFQQLQLISCGDIIYNASSRFGKRARPHLLVTMLRVSIMLRLIRLLCQCSVLMLQAFRRCLHERYFSTDNITSESLKARRTFSVSLSIPFRRCSIKRPPERKCSHFSTALVKLLHYIGYADPQKFSFYPRDAMLARVFAIATCLSVCPSHAGIVPSRAKAGS